MSNAKQIKRITDMLKVLDEGDLQLVEVTVERLTYALAGDEPQEREDEEVTVIDPEEDDVFGEPEANAEDDDIFNDGEEPEENKAEEEDFFGGEESSAEDIFGDDEEPEEPKPVGRRSRAAKEEEKPAPKKPAAKKPEPKEPEYEMIDAPTPLVKLAAKDTELSTKKVMGNKLLEIGISKKTIPEPTNADCLHKGLRFIFAKAYGAKALTLEQVTKKANDAGYDLKFTKGNRGADLKVQAYVTMLLNEGVISWPKFN